MGKGLVVILSGASSVGKGPLRERLLADKDLNLSYSISMTTRQPKANEVEGKDYFFVSHRDFAEAVKNREFLEYTELR